MVHTAQDLAQATHDFAVREWIKRNGRRGFGVPVKVGQFKSYSHGDFVHITITALSRENPDTKGLFSNKGGWVFRVQIWGKFFSHMATEGLNVGDGFEADAEIHEGEATLTVPELDRLFIMEVSTKGTFAPF